MITRQRPNCPFRESYVVIVCFSTKIVKVNHTQIQVRHEDVFSTIRETDRIKSKDPIVTGHGDFSRLLGVLRTTRGFGDYYREACHHRHVMLKPFLSACPDVRCWSFGNKSKNQSNRFEIFTSMDFVIVGSDGLWDVVSPDQAARIVRECLFGKSSRKIGSFKRDEHQSRMVLAAKKLVVRVCACVCRTNKTKQNNSYRNMHADRKRYHMELGSLHHTDHWMIFVFS